MDNTVYVALSSQVALRRHMEIVANNMANLSTPGFKAERMMFREYLQPAGGNAAAAGDKISFVQDIASYNDLNDGPIITTGAPLDVALSGKGYFTVDTPDGPRYTRAGSFSLDKDRRLVNGQGYPVLSASNTPIVFSTNAREIVIADDGTISSREDDPKLSIRIDRLGVVDFADPRQLRSAGDGLLTSDASPTSVANPHVIQGAIEQSNVQGVREMTEMMDILRSYQLVQKTIDSESDRRRDALQQLSKTTAA